MIFMLMSQPIEGLPFSATISAELRIRRTVIARLRLEISRLVVANRTQCLLIESPEPLDFTEEIVLTIDQRIAAGPGSNLERHCTALSRTLRPIPRQVQPHYFVRAIAAS